MKTITILIIVFLLALLGFSLLNKKTTEAPTTVDLNTETPTDKKLSIEKGEFTIDTDKSVINWKANKKVLTDWVDTGIIKIKSGNVSIENNELKSSEIIIDMNSISASTTGSGSGQDRLTNHLKSPDFFNVEKYSTSILKIKSVKLTTVENQALVVADLTMKDLTNEITFVANIKQENDVFNISGETKIDRTLWKVEFGSDKFFQNLGDKAISDEVNIQFNVFSTLIK
jgi:polyisoprenoid-binding protein YceI